MGYLDCSTPTGDIKGAGPVAIFSTPPTVVPDRNRRQPRSLLFGDKVLEVVQEGGTQVLPF